MSTAKGTGILPWGRGTNVVGPENTQRISCLPKLTHVFCTLGSTFFEFVRFFDDINLNLVVVHLKLTKIKQTSSVSDAREKV